MEVFKILLEKSHPVAVINLQRTNIDEKVLIVVLTKTDSLKLATRNITNVELISSSNLNTLSLLKAKQIILTPLAVNNIKEIYCG
jgi:ribosomal protein L4